MSFWELHLPGKPTQIDLDHIAEKVREGYLCGIIEIEDDPAEEVAS